MILAPSFYLNHVYGVVLLGIESLEVSQMAISDKVRKAATANGINPDVADAVVANEVAPAVQPLPDGFVRLNDFRRPKSVSFAELRPYVGKTIQIEDLKIAQDLKSGTMTFSEFTKDDVEMPEIESAIPGGALKAIIACAKARPGDVIVVDVVATKRGLALR
jgi:hypothetical protein